MIVFQPVLGKWKHPRVVPTLAVCLGYLVLFACTSSAKNHPNTIIGKQDTTHSYFGLHIHRADAGSPWPTFNFGSWRLWDAHVGWVELQPERGRWDFRRLDRYLDLAEQAGVEVLLPLGRTPWWASARSEEKSAYGPGQAAEPSDIEDWRNYVHAVALRYKGRIRHYELWNEPNLSMFFSGKPAKLLELQQEAYRILKETDPSNLLVMPAATSNRKWLDAYLALGGARHADVIGYHFYAPRDEPEVIVKDVQAVRALMQQHGTGEKPLWNTEAGWRVPNTDGTPDNVAGMPSDWKRLSPELAAAYVSRALILGRASGLDRYYWYAWDNRAMGLIEPTSKAYKPAVRAYAKTMEWMLGSRLLGCAEAVSIWRCELADHTGRRSWVVWRTQASMTTWRPPIDWDIRSYETLLGKKASIPKDGLRLGELPTRVLQ